jgi:rhodanese-related sulfurtransferase
MIYHITPSELRAKLTDESIHLLDVREDYEHDEFNIGGQLIPLDEIMAQAEQIPRDKTVVVYCKKGIRSQIAIQRLEDKFGFTNLLNLKGGLEAWKKEL